MCREYITECPLRRHSKGFVVICAFIHENGLYSVVVAEVAVFFVRYKRHLEVGRRYTIDGNDDDGNDDV